MKNRGLRARTVLVGSSVLETVEPTRTYRYLCGMHAFDSYGSESVTFAVKNIYLNG